MYQILTDEMYMYCFNQKDIPQISTYHTDSIFDRYIYFNAYFRILKTIQ